MCRCDCENELAVLSANLTSGRTRSCGCGHAKTHGMHNTKTYHAWESLKARCLNEKSAQYPDYGGRGITVCERWMRFENFYDDMGETPVSLTLDRIDNDKGYEPGNCRWTDRLTQQANRRVARLLTFHGATKTMEQWAKQYGIGSGTLHQRIFVLGWDMERALTTPLRQIKRKSEWLTALRT